MKLTKKWVFIICSILCISFLLNTYLNNKTDEINHLKRSTDSLYMVNNSLNYKILELSSSIDSLENLSNKVDTALITINNYYEKEFIDITNQSIASDAKFFSKYLSEDSSRFFDCNISKAIKTN